MSGYESDTCGRSYTIRIRYVWTQIFLYPHKKNCGYKNLWIRVDGGIKPCPFSDHDFVYLSIQSSGNNSRGPGCWKFNNLLLNDSAFCEYLTTCIDDLSGSLQHFPSVKSWWDFFKHSIRSQIRFLF